MAVRLDRITTRGGDTGQTSLSDGTRLPKSHPRIALMGAVDEANAALGLAQLESTAPYQPLIEAMQQELFDLGADFSLPWNGESAEELRITEPYIQRLEKASAALNADLPPLKTFVLPGGTRLAAALHLARTITRRAEHLAWGLAGQEPLNPTALAYLNRLSDHLFILSRHANHQAGTEPTWKPGTTRA